MHNKRIAAGVLVGMLGLVFALGVEPSGADSTDELATIRVTKVVTGVAPPGTEFVVTVGDCRNRVDQELTFGPTGGTQDAIFDPGVSDRDCTITEVPPGDGCETVTIEPATVTLVANTTAEYPVTVTNSCPEAVAAVDAEPADAEPAVAEPVAAQPVFTG
jgi:hypothetical protein